MKKILFAISTALLMFAGCKKTDIISEGSGVGTVNFSISADEGGYITKALPEVDIETLKISIVQKDGDYSEEWDSFSAMPSVLELSSGNYTVTASTPDSQPVAWDQPVYGGSKDFTVMVGKVSNVDLVCSITNMMVSINPSESFLKELSFFEVTVKSNDGSRVWTKTEYDEGKDGFFNVSPLEVWVKGERYDGESIKQQYLKITEVAAKDHHIINLDAKVTGSVGGIDFTIDNTVNDREENITVPGFEEIPVEDEENPEEPDGVDTGDEENPPVSTAPVMEWASNPTFETMPISSDMDVVINISAQEKIKAFVVKVESPSAEFLATVSAMVSPENAHLDENYVNLDLINDATAIAMLSSLMPTGDALKGQTSVDFSLSELVPMINGFSPASGSIHTFTLNVTDEKDQTLSKPVSFKTE